METPSLLRNLPWLQKPSTWLAFLCLIYLAIIWCFHLGAAAAGYPMFRAQHLGAALLYAQNGIDLLRPVIPGFNATGTPTPLEVPFWQAAAALALRVFNGWWGAANLASLLIFSTCIFPLFWLAHRWLGTIGAWWAVLFFLAQPIVFYQAGIAATDSSSLAALVWFLYYIDLVIYRQTWSAFAGALITGICCAVSKLPFFMEAGFASGLMLLWQAPKSLRAWAMVIGIGIITAIILLFWFDHTDSMLDLAEFRYRKITLFEIPEFYFGSLSYRLDLLTYVRGGWIVLNAICGSFILAALPVWGLFVFRKSWGWALVLGSLAVAMVFFHLILVHKHYYLMLTPAAALLSAAAIKDLSRRFEDTRVMPFLAIVFVPFLFFSTIQGLMGLEVYCQFDPYPKQIASIIKEHTQPNDHLLIAGGGWGGDLLIRSGRQGLSTDSTASWNASEQQKRLQALGYNVFVSVSESPLLNAVQETNPGSFNRKRILWESATSQVDKSWPIIYSDENIVIKKIMWE